MLFASVGQGALFVWMVAAGMAIACWYALTRALARLFAPLSTGRRARLLARLVDFICDLLLGAGAALLYIAFLLHGNRGRVRAFTLLALPIGGWLFACGLLPPLCALARALRRGSCLIVNHLSKIHLINVIFK